jgi:hypothetical protein
MVLREGVFNERDDPVMTCYRDEVLKEDRSQALPLEGVVDQECESCVIGSRAAVVTRNGDDTVISLGHESDTIGSVYVSQVLNLAFGERRRRSEVPDDAVCESRPWNVSRGPSARSTSVS